MIRPATLEDIQEIISISDEAFGPNYYQPETIKLDSDTNIAIVSVVGNSVSGFGLSRILKKHEIKEAFENHHVPNFDELFLCNTIGLLKTLAVRSSFKGQGIGVRLFKEMENKLRLLGAERFIVPAWKDETGIPVEKILKSFKYESFLEIPFFWSNQCDSGNYKCISRKDKCICSAVFYKDTY